MVTARALAACSLSGGRAAPPVPAARHAVVGGQPLTASPLRSIPLCHLLAPHGHGLAQGVPAWLWHTRAGRAPPRGFRFGGDRPQEARAIQPAGVPVGLSRHGHRQPLARHPPCVPQQHPRRRRATGCRVERRGRRVAVAHCDDCCRPCAP
eukprot:458738-Pleurochrysis_carterae.AAC.2